MKKWELKKDEDILTYALYPAVAPKFLKEEVIEEPLEKANEVENKYHTIPTEYSVEVDGELFDVKVVPTGFMEIGSGMPKLQMDLLQVVSLLVCKV